MRYVLFTTLFLLYTNICLSQNTTTISKCNCPDDISALSYGNIENSGLLSKVTLRQEGYSKVTFLSSSMDSSQLSFYNGISENLFKHIYHAGKIKNKLYINTYNNLFESVNASLNQLNLTKVVAQFEVSDASGYLYIIFNDANEDKLFAMKKEFWDYLEGISGQTNIYAIEIQQSSNESNSYHEGYEQFKTELYYFATKNTFTDQSLHEYFFEKNSKIFYGNVNDEGINIETRSFTTYFNDMIWYENTPQRSFNLPAFMTTNDSNIYSWAFDHSIYLESFVRKYSPKELFTIDGLNTGFDYNSIESDLLTKSYWLGKIKSDSLLQSLIIPIHIKFGPISSGDLNSLYSLQHPSTLTYNPIAPVDHINTRYWEFFSSSQVNKIGEVTFDKFPPFYSLNKNTVEEKIACAIQNILSDHMAQLKIRAKNVNERKIDDQKRAKYKADLISKYGQKYVDDALNGDITIGMPEDLLSIPLRVWTVTSVSKFNDGYDMYCYFNLDVSKRIRISVRNGKVSGIVY